MAVTMTLDQARGIVQGVSPDSGTPTPGDYGGILPPGYGGGGDTTGTWSQPVKGQDGKYYEHNSATDEWRLAPAQFQPAAPDLAGTDPLTHDPNYYVSSPDVSPNATRFVDQYGNIVDEKGQPVTPSEYTRLARQFGGTGDIPGSGNPYAGEANSRANQSLADQEAQQKVNNAITWQELLNSQNNADRNFGLSQITGNRNELASRAGAGVSTGNLALNLAQRSDSLAKDPGNFPAWLQAMQDNTGTGPSAQSLTNAGTRITPAQNNWVDTPEFKSLLSHLIEYGTVPNAGAVADTQKAYNADPNAAQQFFSQNPADLQRMFGKPMAEGGSFMTQGPMTFKDLSTGKNIATAGEAGDEQVTVTPAHAPNAGLFEPTPQQPIFGMPDNTAWLGKSGLSAPQTAATGGGTGTVHAPAYNLFPNTPAPGTGTAGGAGGGIPTAADLSPEGAANYAAFDAAKGTIGPSQGGVSPAAGTFMALAKALRANGYTAGQIPSDVLARMEQGFAPAPGDIPDWILNNPKIPLSLRQMLLAGVKAQLGGTGFGDWNDSRQLYAMGGFSGAGGVVR